MFTGIAIKAFLKSIAPQFIIGVLIVAAFVGYSNYLYNRGKKEADQRYQELEEEAGKRHDAMEQSLKLQFSELRGDMIKRMGDLDKTQTTSHTTIINEAKTDPRLTDPEKGITDNMLQAINDARKESWK